MLKKAENMKIGRIIVLATIACSLDASRCRGHHAKIQELTKSLNDIMNQRDFFNEAYDNRELTKTKWIIVGEHLIKMENYGRAELAEAENNAMTEGCSQ